MQLLLEKFAPLWINWDLKGVRGNTYVSAGDMEHFTMKTVGLRLEPGYGYLFSATIQIMPLYSSSLTEIVTLEGWSRTITQQSCVRFLLPAGQRNVVRYYYSVSFDDRVLPAISQYRFQGLQFLYVLGSLPCYTILGTIILTLYNVIVTQLQGSKGVADLHSAAKVEKVDLQDAYLHTLAQFATDAAGAEDIQKTIETIVVEAKELDWSTNKKRQELGRQLTPTGFLCLQVLYEAFILCKSQPDINEGYNTLMGNFRDWRADSSKNEETAVAMWKTFWPNLGAGRMRQLLTEIMPIAKVEDMLATKKKNH